MTKEQFGWFVVAALGTVAGLALLALAFAGDPPEQLVCHRWDYSEAVLAERHGDELRWTDHNGMPRVIRGADSGDWQCDK